MGRNVSLGAISPALGPGVHPNITHPSICLTNTIITSWNSFGKLSKFNKLRYLIKKLE